MRLLQGIVVVFFCLTLVSQTLAADVETAPGDERHYIEIPLGDRPSQPAASTAANADVSPEVAALIQQLGDGDFRKREAAAVKLKEMGPAALPGLRQARDTSADPEVANRAEAIVRSYERPPLPSRFSRGGETNRRGAVGGFRGNFNLRFNGNRIEVREPGREISIVSDADGIRMSVTSLQDGKQVTREYKAATPDELQRLHPEAFELYQRWAGRAADRGFQRREQFRRQFDRGVEPEAMLEIREMLRRNREALEAQGGAGGAAAVEDMLKFFDRVEAEQRAARKRDDALEQRVREFEQNAREKQE